MSKFLSNAFAGLVPYTPGEQPQPGQRPVIKLNTNENPYPPAPAVRRLLQQLDEQPAGQLRLYSDPEATDLRQAVAEFYDLQPEQVFVGNGSDEVLAFAFLAYGKGRRMVFPDITYAFYNVFAALFDVEARLAPLDEDFNIQPVDYLEDAEETVVLANPNAITGKNLPLVALEQILQFHTDSMVIVDEAYVDFGGESAVALLPKYENLLVVQTLSKSRSLAGARVGIALGQPAVIADLNTIKFSFNPYNVNRDSQALAAAAVRDKAYFAKCCQNIMANRQLVTEGLEAQGFQVLPSLANFVLARHQLLDGQQLYQKLKQRDILVRWFDEPRIRDFVRISIGTREDMQQLLAAVAEILQEVR